MKIITDACREVKERNARRLKNRKVCQGFDELRAIAVEDHQEEMIELPTVAILFICECGDSNCGIRIPLTIEQYAKKLAFPDCYVVSSVHKVDDSERVIVRRKYYTVIKHDKNACVLWQKSA